MCFYKRAWHTLQVASTVIHLDKSRAALDLLLGMKGPMRTLRTHHVRRASAMQAKSWRPPFEGAKAVFTFIYGSCRLNPAPPLPSDGTLQTNYRGPQKKTRRMWEENKRHLRCFWWQICIAFNQSSNSTVDKSLLSSRWQESSLKKHTHTQQPCLQLAFVRLNAL